MGMIIYIYYIYMYIYIIYIYGYIVAIIQYSYTHIHNPSILKGKVVGGHSSVLAYHKAKIRLKPYFEAYEKYINFICIFHVLRLWQCLFSSTNTYKHFVVFIKRPFLLKSVSSNIIIRNYIFVKWKDKSIMYRIYFKYFTGHEIICVY